MQFQADLLGIPVHRPAILESTAQGAAYLAGLATGFWSSTDEIAQTRGDHVFQPAADRAVSSRQYARWQQAVQRSKGWSANEAAPNP
jgi:glycerol kinase